MSTRTTSKIAFVTAMLAGALLLSAPAGADSRPADAADHPGRRGAARTAGFTVQPAANMAVLKTTPDIGLAGTAYTVSGSGLAANKDVNIVWNTANVTWIVDARARQRRLPRAPGHQVRRRRSHRRRPTRAVRSRSS